MREKKNKIVFFIFIFLFLTNVIYSNNELLVKKNELFKINLPANKFSVNYYIEDYNKSLLSYYGQEYFPATDEFVYYFKAIREGESKIKIIREKQKEEEKIIYNVIIIEKVDDEFITNEKNIIKPKLKKVAKVEKSEAKQIKKFEYERANGLKKMNEDEINKKKELIKKYYENNYYVVVIKEGEELLNNRLIKGVREEVSYIIGEAYAKINNYDSAINIVRNLNNFRDEYINKGRIDFFTGRMYYENNNFDSAIITLLKMINYYGDNEWTKEAYYYLALSNIKIGRIEKGIDYLKYIVSNYQGTLVRANALYMLGNLFETEQQIRNFFEAFNYYRLLHKQYPHLEISEKARQRAEYLKENYL
ncbi:MAG TPA: tetratricopeptide repeat protein [bacterium]|mgnify:CR=1 FL=1|nr:tetratricopeptide repeat protein [bacterium]HOL48295.1 tetratricopeptide repeat protein [bacterium]HPQ19378.1 tetratricopeptide repeat protein [bacterium]